jgi:peptide chain release factor 1
MTISNAISYIRGSEGEEMVIMARAEIDEAKSTLIIIEEKIVKALTPRDEADDRGVVLEVRAGTGIDMLTLNELNHTRSCI